MNDDTELKDHPNGVLKKINRFDEECREYTVECLANDEENQTKVPPETDLRSLD